MVDGGDSSRSCRADIQGWIMAEATPYLEIQNDALTKEKRYKRNPQAEELLRRRSARLLLA